MAGTTVVASSSGGHGLGDISSVVKNLHTQHGNVLTDLETLRVASGFIFNYKVENLAADADITARGFFYAPLAMTVTSVVVIPEAASTGVDGSNTLIITLRNITQGNNVASVTRTADLAANTAVTLTIANASITGADVLGLVVTQGSTADASTFVIQFVAQLATVDAAADLVAAAITLVP